MAPPAVGEASWRVDETCVKVRGRWAYLYRALDKLGNTIDFYLSVTRITKATKRFLGKALRGWKEWEMPEVLNTYRAPTYAAAIAELKAEGKCPEETRYRQVNYLNNTVEADHGKLKLLIRPVRGFKTLKTAYATIRGFEGHARAAQGPGEGVRHSGRHSRRREDRRARLRHRPMCPDRGDVFATGPSGHSGSIGRNQPLPRFTVSFRPVCNRAVIFLLKTGSPGRRSKLPREHICSQA